MHSDSSAFASTVLRITAEQTHTNVLTHVHADTNGRDIKCTDCNRSFCGDACYESHKTNKVCDRFKICGDCTRGYNTVKSKKHDCDATFCIECSEEKPLNHNCFMPQMEIKRDTKVLNIFGDLETNERICWRVCLEER